MRKKEILSLMAAGIELEDIMLNKISQRKRNSALYQLYMQS